MSRLLKWFKPGWIWFDDHILEYLSFALLIFIPLYPKIPITEILPGYIVRLRLDDLLVAFAFTIWVIWLIRKKVTLKGNPLVIPIAIYLLVGLLSSLSAIFITKTVPPQSPHVEKLFLHFLRRFEYFSVFFIFFSSIKSLAQIKKYVYTAAIVLLFVTLYGFGQKYLYWPAFSTMNREFSKGVKLYLSEHARVLSTFGGHYDLASYLMIVLTLFIPIIFVVKKLWHKSLFLLASIAGFWLLILTVSRTSFIAYVVSITVVFAILSVKKGLIWSLSRWFVVMTISLSIMLSFGDLSDRFAHVLKVDKFKNAAFKPLKEKPQGEEVAYIDISKVSPQSDIPPSSGKPSDVVVDVPEFGTEAEGTFAAKPRVYSQAE